MCKFLSICRNLGTKNPMYPGSTEKVTGKWHDARVDRIHYSESLEHIQISQCNSEEREDWKHLALTVYDKHHPSCHPSPTTQMMSLLSDVTVVWCHSCLMSCLSDIIAVWCHCCLMSPLSDVIAVWWCHSCLLKVHWNIHHVPSLSPQNATWEAQTMLAQWTPLYYTGVILQGPCQTPENVASLLQERAKGT